MQDRVPRYPGRVKLVPVSGQENVFDLVRADQSTQDGTPLSKATLLKDATAALFGLGTTAVPDDVLSWIGRYVKSAPKISVGSYVGTGSRSKTITFSSPPKCVIIGHQSGTPLVWFSGMPDVYINTGGGGDHSVDTSISGNTLTITAEAGRTEFNSAGYTYRYLAMF